MCVSVSTTFSHLHHSSLVPPESTTMHLQLHNSTLSITFMASILFLFMLFKIFKRWSSSNNNNLPPGPWALPLIGNLHQVIGSSMPHHCFKDLADKYEPLMHLKLGEVSNIIATSPEIAKEVMKTQDRAFCDRPNLFLVTMLSYNATDIAFSPYGEYWRQLRKICVVELLSPKRVQSFRSIREEEVSELVKTISASEGSAVNLTQLIFSTTYGITARAAFGKKHKHQQVFISTIVEALNLAGRFCIADLYPSIGMFRRTSRAKAKLEKLLRETDRILQDIINDHKNSHMEERDEDLVDVLLRFQQENDSQYHLADDSIKAVIQDMFAAAAGETSSGVVLWGMAEMIKNSKVMEEAQAEVRRVFDSKGYVDETELHQLLYLKCVIKETLRLHPSVPLLLPRENRERCQINGYTIPAKSRVSINVWAIGRDPKYWDEAERFKPERFLNSSIDFKGTDFEYIPFGSGRRMCPGMAFGLPTVELPLAQLLYHFDWKLPIGMKNEDLDMAESFAISLRRANDLCLIPIIRRHLSK